MQRPDCLFVSSPDAWTGSYAEQCTPCEAQTKLQLPKVCPASGVQSTKAGRTREGEGYGRGV